MKQILNYELWVDEKGQIHTKNGPLKLGITNKGYLFARPRINGTKKYFSVHREVAFAYLPNPKNLPQVGHKNNDKKDNRIENLYWTDNSENQKKNHSENRVKLSERFSKEMRNWIRKNTIKGSHTNGITQMAKKLNCGYMTIFRIVNNIRWKND